MSYGISIQSGATSTFVRSEEIVRRLEQLPDTPETRHHIDRINEIETQGISRSNEDFDVLSAAVRHIERSKSA